MPAYDLCLVTAGDARTARKLADGLLRGRLAACVTALPGAESRYRWKGRVETARETLLLIKTRRALRSRLLRFVRANHPYEVPEVLFLAVSAGLPEYLAWLGASTALTAKATKNEAPEKKRL